MSELTIDDVRAARERIHARIHETPILRSSLLDGWLGHEVFFKAECFQRIGAFKSRGALNTVEWLVEAGRKPKHVVANSSGNHAQAVAWAAAQHGIEATIFMPRNVSRVKAQATAAYGARLSFWDTRQQVDEEVERAAGEPGTYWIPPFDHEQVICGQGTAALEALEALGSVDAVFTPCGGGGLLSGTFLATRGLLPHAKVFGAEPASGNDAARSYRLGSIQVLPEAPDTLADGARTLSIGETTFHYVRRTDGLYEVSEAAILYWTQWLTHLLKVHVEPTSAMVMDGVREWLRGQTQRRKVLVILSGGNVDDAMMRRLWAENHLTNPPTL